MKNRLLCLIGKHDWLGCTCMKCGMHRDEGHEWMAGWGGWKETCKCGRCGATRDVHHDFSKDCRVCSVCGKSLSEEDAQHDFFFACRCRLCGKDTEHQWNGGCKCTRCNSTRDEGHAWGEDCAECWRCHKRRTIEHDWTRDCRHCARCRVIREVVHLWRDGHCSACSVTEKEYLDTIRYRELQDAVDRRNWERAVAMGDLASPALLEYVGACQPTDRDLLAHDGSPGPLLHALLSHSGWTMPLVEQCYGIVEKNRLCSFSGDLASPRYHHRRTSAAYRLDLLESLGRRGSTVGVAGLIKLALDTEYAQHAVDALVTVLEQRPDLLETAHQDLRAFKPLLPSLKQAEYAWLQACQFADPGWEFAREVPVDSVRLRELLEGVTT